MSNALTFVLPKDYGYVLGVALSTSFLTIWQGQLVTSARKAAKIAYPQPYAEVAEAKASPAAQRFNCAQRAHQNTLEVLPSLLTSLLIGGLHYPRWAAGFGAIAVAGRIVYTLGYSSGEPKKRLRGAFEYLGRIPLLFVAGKTVYDIIT